MTARLATVLVAAATLVAVPTRVTAGSENRPYPGAAVSAGSENRAYPGAAASAGSESRAYPRAAVSAGSEHRPYPGAAVSADSEHRPSPGAAAASFPAGVRVVDVDGRTWSSDSLRGRVVLVDFWATWCAPCLADLPRLQRLQARHGRRDLTILGVSLDRGTVRDFRSWLQRQGIDWPQVREPGGFDGSLARALGVDVVPATFLFDRQGRLRASALRGAALEAQVTALVETR